MDEKLILSDGTEWSGHMLESGGRLFVYVYGKNLTETFKKLNDPTKTAVIRETGSVEKAAEGYTHLYSVTEESENMTSAALRKG